MEGTCEPSLLPPQPPATAPLLAMTLALSLRPGDTISILFCVLFVFFYLSAYASLGLKRMLPWSNHIVRKDRSSIWTGWTLNARGKDYSIAEGG